MNVTYLAAHDAALQAGYLIAALGVPTAGWILLIVGLKQRSRTRPQPGARPTDHPAAPPGESSGTRLIVIGAVLMAIGVLAIVGRLASAGSKTSEGSGSTAFNSEAGLLTTTTYELWGRAGSNLVI